ncbi:hypothetical protein Mic1_65 [Microcystis phage Mic1]|nr:hypothetical protein Mic1_65 [Microcystis phage Mic1]
MIKVRLSYHSYDDLFNLFDAGIIDLNTKCQVSLSEIEDYENFGWLELTADNLKNVCGFCVELGIEANGSLSTFRHWYSEDVNYHLELKSDQSENLEVKIREINLKLLELELIKIFEC